MLRIRKELKTLRIRMNRTKLWVKDRIRNPKIRNTSRV